MRVLMLNNEFPPLGGGTGVVNYEILRQIREDHPDIYIDLVTSSRTKRNQEVEIFSDNITIYKVPVDNKNIHHSTNIELIRYFMRGFLFSHKLIREQSYDLSFAFAGVPAGVISYLLNRLHRLPYIISLQGPDVPGFEARYNYLYPFLKPMLKQVWRRAVRVLAISEEQRALALKTTPELEIPIVYNGVRADIFFPHPENEPAEQNILCVGRLIERKGQHHLIHAYARLVERIPDIRHRLILAGTGDAEHSLRSLVESFNLTDRVIFLGYVTATHMPDVYQKADIFILPSQNEGMSIALLEALASGLAVVVTPTGGTAELVRNEYNGIIVEWGNIEELSQALEKLVQDQGLCKLMGSRSRQIVMNYSWCEIISQYYDLFQQATYQK